MDIGNLRRIDRAGRVVIPNDIRRLLNIPDDSLIEILVDGDSIILKRYKPKESLINSLNELHERLDFESYDLDYHDVREIEKRIDEIRTILSK